MEPITLREKLQWAMEAADAKVCTEEIAEAIVKLLEERGYRWERRASIGVFPVLGDSDEPQRIPESEWLAILDEAARRAASRPT